MNSKSNYAFDILLLFIAALAFFEIFFPDWLMTSAFWMVPFTFFASWLIVWWNDDQSYY